MRQLAVIIAAMVAISAGFVNAAEHSALSNIFTLDTRTNVERVPLEHSAVSNIFTLDTEAPSWDLNSDGIIDIADLIIVAGVFGQSGEGLTGDLNSDGVVDIMDPMIVAIHFGETTNLSAPASPQMANADHVDMVEGWLKAARMADDGSELFQRGISALERLLNQIVPSKTALMQNYPNPFNPDTWIPYQLNEGADISIVIYDATGRIVKRLDVGYKNAGVYRTRDRAAHWNGRNEAGESVASGAYFVSLKAGEYQQVRRIVLIR